MVELAFDTTWLNRFRKSTFSQLSDNFQNALWFCAEPFTNFFPQAKGMSEVRVLGYREFVPGSRRVVLRRDRWVKRAADEQFVRMSYRKRWWYPIPSTLFLPRLHHFKGTFSEQDYDALLRGHSVVFYIKCMVR